MTQRKQLAFAASQLEPSRSLTSSQEGVKALLIERGVSSAKAIELVKRFEPAVLQDRLDYATSQIKSDRKGSLRNPAGYLISFVESDQTIPLGFETSSQKEVLQRQKQAREVAENEDNARSFRQLRLMDQYERWCDTDVDAHIARVFDPDSLAKRLKAISSQLRKDPMIAQAFDRMLPDVRRADLMGILRKEVAKERDLPSFDAWLTNNPQGDLF